MQVSRPLIRQIQPSLILPGTVVASRSVDLVARVPGFLNSINFVDGADVSAGQLLFQIEPDTYRAQLAYDRLAFDNADRELKRQRQLLDTRATSELNVENAQTARDQADEKRELSAINLQYTRIEAPFAGRIGIHLVDAGNMVGASGPTKLATLDRIAPVYVDFTLNEQDAVRLGIFEKLSKGESAIPVSVAATESKQAATGVVCAVDNQMDSATGSIRLRAAFVNADHRLIPGMSVRVSLPSTSAYRAMLIPQSAVVTDQDGASVFIVSADKRIVRRSVTTADRYDSMIAISAGLTADDLVVTGAPGVAAGQKVQSRIVSAGATQ
ncbi:efflux RND transporter periplasmic adaptor subunit [Paraburkholderia rhizosphaerae]|uniref:efflux RND transporter periplasmic adaptor subunit n=1 Tax=Paraburkholderia rhizosphaerae TaxID=480658 RepID=UPI0036732D92